MSIEDIKQNYSEYLEKYQIFERSNEIHVSLVVVAPEHRGKGIGRKLFEDLNDYADKAGKIITLTPDPKFGTTKNNLIKFYQSLGYVLNKGKNKDYEISELMYRPPKMNESINAIVEIMLKDLSL